MELDVTRPQKVNAKTLKIYSKVCDNFTGYIYDDQGNELGGCSGDYVPKFMPGDHYGDYIILDIDLDTGQILNWVKPSPEDVAEFINKNEEDE